MSDHSHRSIDVFIRNLKRVMADLGIKDLKELSDYTGMSYNTIKRLIHKKAMTLDYQDRLAVKLGKLSAADIYNYLQPAANPPHDSAIAEEFRAVWKEFGRVHSELQRLSEEAKKCVPGIGVKSRISRSGKPPDKGNGSAAP